MDINITMMPNLKRKSTLFLLIPLLAFSAVAVDRLCGVGKGRAWFGYAHELSLAGVGLFLFGYGFRELRKKRLVENTPTSKVRSAAMGFCELAGCARPKTLIRSPLSSTECVCYRFKIEEERADSKGRKYWATVKEGGSAEYFYVEDATGKMLIDPLNAELLLAQDYQQINGSLFQRRTRHTEWFLRPGDYVYLLGTVKKFRDAALQRRDTLNERLRALKADTARLTAFDTNKDGQISAEEWDAARRQTEQALLEEELRRPPDDTDDLVIAKGTGEQTFVIADRDERDVAGNFMMKSAFSSIGGIALTLLMFASMLARLGILSRVPPIPWEAFYR